MVEGMSLDSIQEPGELVLVAGNLLERQKGRIFTFYIPYHANTLLLSSIVLLNLVSRTFLGFRKS